MTGKVPDEIILLSWCPPQHIPQAGCLHEIVVRHFRSEKRNFSGPLFMVGIQSYVRGRAQGGSDVIRIAAIVLTVKRGSISLEWRIDRAFWGVGW